MLQIADIGQIATGRGYAGFLDPKNTATRYDAVMQSAGRDAGSGFPYQTEYCLQAGRDGATRLWVEDNGRWFAGPDGRPARAHGVVRVVNERHDHEQRLAYLSRFDRLTGEMNRNALTETLATALDEAVKYRGSCGFMLIAVDNLARINEAYGFGVADEVIASVGRRIRSRMRGGDMLGRFAGNKFGVVLNTCTPDDLTMAADRFLGWRCARTWCRPRMVRSPPRSRSAASRRRAMPARSRRFSRMRRNRSIPPRRSGAARSSPTGRTSSARPCARKTSGHRRDRRGAQRAAHPDRLRAGGDDRGRQLAFYECLMRIRRADGSIVPASAVIPVAEQLGLVRLIDHRVIELVTAELVAAPALKASLNVSPDSITDPDWWSALGAQLRARPGVAQRMILEITETAAIQNIDETAGFVTRAKDFGCRIAIDDFGAGYTSFRNLRKLGVDIVKIDGAFVQNLPRSEDDRVFVRTLIELGRSLGLTTVAEWVQDEEAAAMLADWGCDYLQGDLIGRATLERPWAKDGPEAAAS